MTFKAINWNRIEDYLDKSTWEKLTEQFWLDTRIPISNDLDDWRRLPENERELVSKVFGGLTLLDTLQSENGVDALIKDVTSQHEEAVLRNIAMMEAIHAKSYSSIFSTLLTPKEIDEIFDWTYADENLQKKAKIVDYWYQNGTPLQKKVASVFLESFLFYSGFYTPLYYLGNNKLPNVAEVIKLIIRDECLTSDHELLTPNGWKSIKDVTVSDKVLQYHEDGQMTFVNPKRVSSHYEHETYSFKNEQGHISLQTSPKHRVITQSKDTGLLMESEAHEYKNGNKDWLNTGLYNNPRGREHLSTIERFMIAVHADGSYPTERNRKGEFRRSGEKTGAIPVKFAFKKHRKIERIQYLADKLNYEVTSFKDEQGRLNLIVQVDKDVIPTDRVKRLPIPNLSTVSSNWCKEYIEEISFWDGHVVAENPERITYGSVDENAVVIVQTIATLAGYRTHKTVREDKRKESYKDYHRLQINKNNNTTNSQVVIKTKESGQMVYGVEVDSSYLVTKHNNAICVTGNSVHGTYIGYKHQIAYNQLSEDEKEVHKEWVYNLLLELYENEVEYTHNLYDSIGWTDEVVKFLEYNANKALMNLGFDALFPTTDQDVNPIVMNGISTGTANHDFFSQVGNGYLLGQVEAMQESDYDYGRD